MIKTLKLSLVDLLGREYMEGVIEAASIFSLKDKSAASKIANEKVEFYPESFSNKVESFIEKIGLELIPPVKTGQEGACTSSFKKASNLNASPVSGLGYLRLGEDGKVYLAAKSEHYHAPLGHSFPGYKLLDNARSLGITNATHNNTRGYITRLLEAELIRTINGLALSDKEGLCNVISSEAPHVLNRVINLETGSLAVEAGVKMMLAKFYKAEKTSKEPEYTGKVPVFFVMGDKEGGRMANYHGTTVITQMMRDLWPEIYAKVSSAGIMEICPVAINDLEDFKNKFAKYNQGKYKAAGFLHEIIIMNYGGMRLKEEYLKQAYEICHAGDTPVLVDEIQSCMWYPGMYLFRLYGLNPDFVAVGKGFPGGQYAASKIITTAVMDNLSQFGALVTNGQEELASLAYLITMAFAQENSAHIGEIGKYYENKVKETVKEFPAFVDCVEGQELLISIYFKTEVQAIRFTELLNAQCIDISAHTYKAKCPPAALTKLPIIASKKMTDFLIAKMKAALIKMNGEKKC
ncbi:MAG: aminotransferase class III-fold pyridoxal phosphate-dependent enzyme [Candidatus Firestonebacteria bacterium]